MGLVQRWRSYAKLSIAAVQGRFAQRPPISPPTWGRSMAWKMVLGRLVDDGGGSGEGLDEGVVWWCVMINCRV